MGVKLVNLKTGVISFVTIITSNALRLAVGISLVAEANSY